MLNVFNGALDAQYHLSLPTFLSRVLVEWSTFWDWKRPIIQGGDSDSTKVCIESFAPCECGGLLSHFFTIGYNVSSCPQEWHSTWY
jgi:hypothetical protein